MKFQLLQKITTLLIVVALLFVGHSDADAMVLCVGIDGHIELEDVSKGNCTTDSDSHEANSFDDHEIRNAQSNQDHCGSCLDFPITIGGTDKCHPIIQVTKTQINIPYSNTTLMPLNQHLPSGVQPGLNPALTRTPASLMCIRTVSLLI